MENFRARGKAPDAVFSLGDDEDDSLGHVQGQVTQPSLHGCDAAPSVHTPGALEKGGEGKPQLNGKHLPPVHASQTSAAASEAPTASRQDTTAPASAAAVSPSEPGPGAVSGPGDVASNEGEEEEEQRIARELAALEAEAEAMALQEQQQKGASGATGKSAVDGNYPVKLAEDPHEKAMVTPCACAPGQWHILQSCHTMTPWAEGSRCIMHGHLPWRCCTRQVLKTVHAVLRPGRGAPDGPGGERGHHSHAEQPGRPPRAPLLAAPGLRPPAALLPRAGVTPTACHVWPTATLLAPLNVSSKLGSRALSFPKPYIPNPETLLKPSKTPVET